MNADNLPNIIPPGTTVRLARADGNTPCWQGHEGTVFTIGYYCPDCGLETLWLVNDKGEYTETVDRAGLLAHFEILSLSDDIDYFGENIEPGRNA
jgi:hypothetical protein